MGRKKHKGRQHQDPHQHQQQQQQQQQHNKRGGPPPSEVGTSASPPPPPKEVTAPSHGIRTSPAPPSVAPAAPLLSTSTPQESPGVSESGKGKGVSQPVQEGIITKKADTEDNVTSQDKLASSEVVSNSCTKDTDATSLTEDSSFASCLTDPSTSLSEDGKVKVDSTSQPPVEVSQTSEAALSAKSTDDSPLTSGAVVIGGSKVLHDGDRKDSEYESAPETDIPLDEPPSQPNETLNTEFKTQEETTAAPEDASKEPKEVFEEAEQTLSDQAVISEHITENTETETVQKHLESEEKPVEESKETVAPVESLQQNSAETQPSELIDVVKSENGSRDVSELARSESVSVPENPAERRSASDSTSGQTPIPPTDPVPQTEESKVESAVSDSLPSVDRNNQSNLKETVLNECEQITETKEPAESKSCPDKTDIPVTDVPNEEVLIAPSKGYDLSFLDQIDDSNFNPFVTKTAIRNSPPPSPQPGVKLPPLKPAIKKKGSKATKPGTVPDSSAEKPDTTGGPEKDLKVVGEKQLEDSPKEDNKVSSSDQQLKEDLPKKEGQKAESCELPTQNSLSENAIPIEKGVFEIEVDNNKPNKPPPKLGERRPTRPRRPIKKQVKKVIETNNNCIDGEGEKLPEEKQEEDLPLPPSKGYNLDFLDDIDSFNPFQTRSAVSNSPPKDGCILSADELKEFKSKARIVTPKKTQPKKGFDTPVESSKDSNQTLVSARNVDLKKQPEDKENSCPDAGNVPDLVRPTKELEEPPIDVKKDISKASQGPVEVPKEKLQSAESNLNKEPESSVNEVPDTRSSEQEEEVPVKPSKGYNLDFLDDPNFDPFKSRSSIDDKVQPDSEVKEKNKSVSDVSEHKVIKDSTDGVDVTDYPQSDKQVKASVTECKETNVIDKEEAQESKDSVGDLKPSLPEVVRKQSQEVKSPVSEDGHSDESPTESSILKVPSVNKIGRLDSSEFAELLGNEASRLAEELMNCSFDSGLHDSNESVVTNNSLTSSMADSENNRSSLHFDENVNPFQSKSALIRTPPTKHRQLGNGGNDSDIDPFKPRRTLKREEVPGMEERVDTPSMDEDSGIMVGSRSDLMLEADVNHSEAGPEVAMGLTPSDLKCASQSESDVDELLELHDDLSDEEFLASEEFFKEASCLENQLRKSLVTPLGRRRITRHFDVRDVSNFDVRGVRPLRDGVNLSQTKLSGDEGTPTKDDTPPSLPSPQHKASPPPERRSPPREERSAPEGTSSPTPRSNESAEHKNNNNSGRGKTSVPSGYMSSAQVEELLKQQELQFEEKLLRVELSAGEKEKQLRHSMKSEQKQMAELQGNVDELTQSRDALLKMVGQYKSMLSSLVAEKEKENATSDEKLRAVEMERNQALQDLANVEAAFSDVHRKYERTKQVVDTLRRNEETLRGAVADYETKLQKQEQKMMELQKHAEERIQQANEEYEQLRRSSEQEITKMSALLKKAEMKIISLQEGVDRKSRENQELTQLCDDLINKMGSGK
ncbi:uncharacterized protein LOC143040296 isoform X7 [Oratosquilla oratoria]|uniref:uncharacterized protein LOC143040296 isoform X7 n=1 Tax=Oratosquilla oratoria TaxID=337810 RepID=UPI003F75F082